MKRLLSSLHGTVYKRQQTQAYRLFEENNTRIIYQRLENTEYHMDQLLSIERPLNVNCTADLCLF